MKKLQPDTNLIKDALEMLNIEHLSLGIFDQCLPSFQEEENGWGSPYSNGGADFISFAHNIGFNTIQFGPKGKVSKLDISPYNSTIFSSNPLSLSASLLSKQHPLLFTPDEAMALAEQYCGLKHRVNVSKAWDASNHVISTVYDRFLKSQTQPDLNREFDRFMSKINNYPVNWFERDSIFDVLSFIYKNDDWKQWSDLDQNLYFSKPDYQTKINSRIHELTHNYKHVAEKFALGQFLLQEQHQIFRKNVKELGIKIYGDMQIGFSHQDVWAWRSLFLPGYLMGAPPSRSNPNGQPWGYPVLDPSQFHSENQQKGPALKLIEARTEKMFSQFDGIRIDHPHGLICPWVYKSNHEDPFQAVQNGARLYSSPNISDHQFLSRYAIVNENQLNTDQSYPRYADNWIRYLNSDQINKYATEIDVILEKAKFFGASTSDILCEVLSTWPLPLKEVMLTRGLGRFCITQKADPQNPNDIYRRENSSPQDWIMVGNHDTKPLWRLAAEQKATPWYKSRAELLANEFFNTEQQKNAFFEELMNEPNRFCEAMFSELFLGPSRHVFIFFTDLLGIKELYNKPGIIDDENWTIRIPDDYKDRYKVQSKNGEALNLPRCLAMALKTRFAQKEDAIKLAKQLDPTQTL